MCIRDSDRAARPWIDGHLVLAGLDPVERPEGHDPGWRERCPAIELIAGVLRDELLHDAVLERMEADDDQPPP